ncbi:MAG: methyltransferase domain-containing protein [Candidatus Nanohaloarchaea archaeon]|nr:methyltransferase domain-containing protein [Candidatus Nanohaloarchaea archaeon]
MRYAVLLSREHPDLPLAELRGALDGDGIDHEVVDRAGGGLVLLDGEGLDRAADRVALTFEVAEHLHSFDPDAYQKLAATDIAAGAPFAVRVVRADDTAAPDELEENVGRIIDGNSDAAVELDAPEEVFRIYLAGGEAHLCRLAAEVDRGRFEARTNQKRPFSSPVTIHPRLARALVNLSGVPRGGTVLDPFCGTGGILLEAGLLGCDVYGSDVQAEMVDGARTNLADYGVDADIREAEFGNVDAVFDRDFDAVVTDLPYGNASVTEDDPAEAFAERAADLAETAVFVSDRPELGGYEPRFELYVHRSLTRYVYVVD